MKRIYAALAVLALGIASGCRAQIPSNPTVYSCPLPATGTWTQLETSANEITSLATKDTTAATGTWCYAVTAIINTVSPIGQGPASNVVQVTTTSTFPAVNLAWQAPPTGATPTGYLIYRIAAIPSTLTAPPLGTPTTSVSELVSPVLPGQGILGYQMAMSVAPSNLAATATAQ